MRVVPFDASGSMAGEDQIDVYWGNYFQTAFLERMPRLRWIHCASVGVNRAATLEVKARGIVVTNSRGLLAAPVSAVVLGMICALGRGFHHASRLRTEGRLDRDTFDRYFDEMHDLEGETCLIVGVGEAGVRVATACAALGMRVTGIRRRPEHSDPNISRWFTLDELTEAVRDADYVVNLLPLTGRTTRVFAAPVFAAMKRSAFFINAGRGPTVDEASLVAALESGVIAGAGLDVFDIEPLPQQSRLWHLPQTILMPHVACLSVRYWPRQIALMNDNLRRFLDGQPLTNTIDFAQGY